MNNLGSLPWKGRFVWALATAGGMAAAGLTMSDSPHLLSMTAGRWAIVVAVAAVTGWNWFSPMLLYRHTQAEAFSIDEGAFVILALIAPPIVTMATFAGITLAVQAAVRRPFLKSAFNVGQVLISVEAGLAAMRALSVPRAGAPLSAAAVGAAVVGAAVYFVVNSATVTAMLVAVGSRWRDCVFEGLSARLYVSAIGVLFSALLAKATWGGGWAVALIPVVLISLRYIVAAQFRAEHDRGRLQGLFDITLKANSVLRHETILQGLTLDARRLLHCERAELVEIEPPPGSLAAPVVLHGRKHWLVASGRPPRRPFDEADKGLLSALAAVAEGALTNAELYRQVGLERQTLARVNSELTEAKTTLERRAEELARSNEELDQFASIASHDLQEPLRKVRMFTEQASAIEAEHLSEQGRDYLHRANNAAERMQRLIEGLLKFSRVSTEGRPFVAVDLAEITRGVVSDLEAHMADIGAVVRVGHLPTITADPLQMQQLMLNLLSNALKFRRPGVTPEVEIVGRQEARMTLISVRDNGIGFEPRYSKRIFQVFERLHSQSEYAGTGIGLALCRKIVDRHGGTIEANGSPGVGCTLTIVLPSAEKKDDQIEPDRAPPRAEVTDSLAALNA